MIAAILLVPVHLGFENWAIVLARHVALMEMGWEISDIIVRILEFALTKDGEAT